MKKLFLSLLVAALILITVTGAILFFRPTWILNPGSLAWILQRAQIFQSWSWKSARFDHQWIHWNERRMSGSFDDFCLHYLNPTREVKTCLDFSWDFVWYFDLQEGFATRTLKPFKMTSPELLLRLSSAPPQDQSSRPPDIYGLWKKIWAGYVPDVEVGVKKILIHKTDQDLVFDFSLSKKKDFLSAQALSFTFTGTPSGFELRGPEKFLVPEKLKLQGPWYLRGVKLKGKMSESLLALELSGALEVADFIARTHLPLPLQDDVLSFQFQRSALLATQAQISIPGFKKNLARFAPDPFKELPAPLNVMDGLIKVGITTAPLPKGVLISSVGNIQLRSSRQVLDLKIGADVPLDLVQKKAGALGVSVDFEQVKIQLPRFSRKSPPPQFLPDKRFQKISYQESKRKKPADLNLSLSAEDERSLHLRTNLLDEEVRINFNLKFNQGKKKGYITLLPLKTKIFKRPIRVAHLKVTYQDPREPVIISTIRFPLPEYKITLNLEGPLSKPRYSFSSEPPLPQNDIYAVLLFGRPMADLNPEDKTAAQKTNQLLSQGILSLSVLYFLAGSPVEYVGFDPSSKNATAQFGLGRKTSLRVGGGQEGVNSSAIRRSLGKGWYLDTSVQNTNPGLGRQDKNYGVLLERVINY